jgi:hypothetical protein
MRLGEAQDFLEFLAIKSDHRLAIDEGHRRGPAAQLHEFLERSLVRPDVLDDKRDAVLRKKLLLSITRPSPGLRIYHHLLRHPLLLVSSWPLQIPGFSARSNGVFGLSDKHYTGLNGFGQRMPERA